MPTTTYDPDAVAEKLPLAVPAVAVAAPSMPGRRGPATSALLRPAVE
jgi:hypothetical protein